MEPLDRGDHAAVVHCAQKLRLDKEDFIILVIIYGPGGLDDKVDKVRHKSIQLELTQSTTTTAVERGVKMTAEAATVATERQNFPKYCVNQ